MVEEHATEQGWSFVGRVGVQFELDEAVNPGIFHVRSRAVASHDGLAARPVSPERAATRPRLVLSTGEGERVVPLDARVTTIGRGAEADVRLSDTGVSRLHAEVRVEPGSIVVADLGSTNGTRVNGAPATGAALRDGDTITVGDVQLRFEAS